MLAPVTVTVFDVVDIAVGLSVGSCEAINPPGHVVMRLLLVSTTNPAGKVSTKPSPDLAGFPGALVKVKMSDPTWPTARVDGKKRFVKVGITVYTPSMTPGVAKVIVLTLDNNDVMAVVVSVVVRFAKVPAFPAVTTELVTSALDTSLNLTA